MQKQKIVLTVEMEGPIRPSFDINLYAKAVAYRALNWCPSVKVHGENVKIEMTNEEKSKK